MTAPDHMPEAFENSLHETGHPHMKPLVKAMQFIRGTAVHGVVIDFFSNEEMFIDNRGSKGRRNLTFTQLMECEDLINYTAHIAIAFRLTCGGKDDDRGPDYTLRARPQLPTWLPDNCKLPREDKVQRTRLRQPSGT